MLELFAALFVMLILARGLGEGASRLGLPALVGELFAGILIGPSFLGLVSYGAALNVVVGLGLFFIMMMTALRLQTRDIFESGKRAIALSLMGFGFPFIGVAVASLSLGLPLSESLTVGLILSVTAVPINALILTEMGLVKTRLGVTVITAGVVGDQFALVLLGVLLQLPGKGGGAEASALAANLAGIALFFGGFFVVERLLERSPGWAPALYARIRPELRTREATLGLLIASVIGVSLLGETLGLNFIIGTFFAGLLLNKAFGERALSRSLDVMSGFTFGLLAPVLFAALGVQFDLGSLGSVALLFVILMAAVVGAKFAAGYVGGRVGGFSGRESGLIGGLLNSGGMLELVTASIAFQAGRIDVPVFSLCVAAGVITTAISPAIAKAAYGGAQGYTPPYLPPRGAA